MATYTVVTTSAANVAGNGNTINSTKVKVIANAACVYAINAPASLTANVGPMIPANFPTYINMQGLNNKLSVLPVAGGSTAITVTECGTVYASSVTQNYVAKAVFTMVNNSNIITGTTTGYALAAGQAVSGAGIPFGATISSFTSANVTLSANATANVTATITFSTSGQVTA